MASPIYKGAPSPAAHSGWLNGVTSWFTGSTPAYAGQGLSVRGSSGYFGAAMPAYKPAPMRTDGAMNAPDAEPGSECPDEPERITVLIPRELIEPQQQ